MPNNFARTYAEKKSNNLIEPKIIKLLDDHFKVDILKAVEEQGAGNLSFYLSNCFDDERVEQFLEYLISLKNDEEVQAFLWNDVDPDIELLKSNIISDYFEMVKKAKDSPNLLRNATEPIKVNSIILVPMNSKDSLYILDKTKGMNLPYQDDLTSCLVFFDDETRALFSIYENGDDKPVGYCGITLLDEGYYKYNLEYFMIDNSKQDCLYLALKELVAKALDKQLLVLEDDPYFNYKYAKECLIVGIIEDEVLADDIEQNKLIKKLGFTFNGINHLIDKTKKIEIFNIYSLISKNLLNKL